MSDVSTAWQNCLEVLQDEMPAQHFNTWIRRLVVGKLDDGLLTLHAPNRFIKDWVGQKYLKRIEVLAKEVFDNQNLQLELSVAGASVSVQQNAPMSRRSRSRRRAPDETERQATLALQPEVESLASETTKRRSPSVKKAEPNLKTSEFKKEPPHRPSNASAVSNRNKGGSEYNVRAHSFIDESRTFDNFVEGKSNQLAIAAARQIAESPDGGDNPFFIYGSSGLGKTHIMHAIGNEILRRNPFANVLYLTSQQYREEYVQAIKNKVMDDFKRFYRSLDVLLIDDIQFLTDSPKAQEEFFHTFNALNDGRQQVVLTSDRYPKELEGFEDRLKTRFSWGLTASIEPPELETRMAILTSKAEKEKIDLPDDTAYMIAQRVQGSVRELEGALKRVIAHSRILKRKISPGLVKDALKDLFAAQEKMISIGNIQNTVAEYYNIRVADLLSKRRTRNVARPRQIAMSLAKELTNLSLPEIGDQFGGRDHTTVLHACRKVKELRDIASEVREDYIKLQRSLVS